MCFIGRLLGILVILNISIFGQTIRFEQLKGLSNRVFNVIDYGAKGDNSTDDTSAIQSAITVASTDGGIVYIPRGTYKFSRLTVTKPKVLIKGDGRRISILQSTVTSGKAISFLNATTTSFNGGGMMDCSIYGFANIAQVVPTGTETGIDITAALDITQIVVSSNVATATTTTASGVVAGSTTFVIAGATGDTDLNGSYTVATTPTANTFTFATSGVSNGTYTEASLRVYTAGAWNNMMWRNLEIRFMSNGILTDNEYESRFEDVSVHVVKPATGVNLYVKNGHERWFSRFGTYNPAGSEGLTSIRIAEGSIGDYFYGASLLGSIDGVLLDPAIGYGTSVYGNKAIWGVFTDLYSDSMTTCGVNIAPQASGVVTLWVFNNTWTSAVTKGFCIAAGSGTVTNIQINGGRIRSSDNGIHNVGGSFVQIRGANIDANGGHGIYNSSGTGLDVKDNTITNTTGWGVYITGATDQYSITGNSFNTNTAGTIFDDTGLLNRWIGNNQGVDQTGDPIASSATITIGVKPLIALSGTTTVTTINAAPNWGNRVIYIMATDASPATPTLNTGGNIYSAVTLAQNEIATCIYSTVDSKWHCK